MTIGNGTEVRKARIDNSIILENTTIDTSVHITGSIIGKNVVIKEKKEQVGKQMLVGDKTMIEL